MPKLKRCSPTNHQYKATRNIKYEVCEVCKDVFPCKKACGHLDCCYVRGDKPPAEWAHLMVVLSLDFDKAGLIKWGERKDVK